MNYSKEFSPAQSPLVGTCQKDSGHHHHHHHSRRHCRGSSTPGMSRPAARRTVAPPLNALPHRNPHGQASGSVVSPATSSRRTSGDAFASAAAFPGPSRDAEAGRMAQQASSLGPLAPQRTAVRWNLAGAAGSSRGSHPDVAAMARPPLGSRRQKHQHSRRPSYLPILSLPKFMQWSPLRIIGLLRPKASHARKEPSLRELLLETQKRHKEQLNKDTKERQRQLTAVVVVALLFTFYLAVTCAYLYEWDAPTPVTPGSEKVLLELLQSSVNGSNELDVLTDEP